ncbi:MAG: hypothetical protein A2252_08195 [Elusimicrobia bacterium RIFOXYA2_FULL_39_19]|nr:MAG: hypothetical protein A2252_08195 [Elusimicrobia bacterium RIFOXYA2_FULL_39_19]
MVEKRREMTQDVMLEINKEETGKSMYILRVVSWNKQKPKLEKRAFWKKSDEEEMKMSKIIGLSANDIRIITERKDEILKALEK